MRGPAGARGAGLEMRARPGAQRHRLSHVQRAARAVAEHVDAGGGGQARQVKAARHAGPGQPPRRRAAPRAAPPAGREQLDSVRDRGRVRAQAAEQRTEDSGARLGVGQGAVLDLDLDAQRGGQRREPALAHQRGEAARQGDRAQHRRIGPLQAGALEGLPEHAAVERRRVGDEGAPGQTAGQLRQDAAGRRRLGDHLLRDPGQALDAARERSLHAHERLESLVQLPAADQHGAHLGQLAVLAGGAVGLDVDGEELGRGQRQIARFHTEPVRPGSDGMQRPLRLDGTGKPVAG